MEAQEPEEEEQKEIQEEEFLRVREMWGNKKKSTSIGAFEKRSSDFDDGDDDVDDNYDDDDDDDEDHPTSFILVYVGQ